MRSIHLQLSERGDWVMTIMATAESCRSTHSFSTSAQAVRAFTIEGRHQPFARMVVHACVGARVTVVRRARLPAEPHEQDRVDLQTVRRALDAPVLQLVRSSHSPR